MANPLAIAGSACVGAAAMYFLDPDKGNRRRALVRDQFIHACAQSSKAAGVVRRDSANRLQGLYSEVRSAFTGEQPPDDVLAERVRSKMGRWVSHPAAIDVVAANGRVILRGPILAGEVQCLMNNVGMVHGVHRVVNELDIHTEPGDIPALQGEGRHRALLSDAAPEYWSPAMQAAIGTAALGYTAMCLLRRSPASLFLGGVCSVVACQSLMALMTPGFRGQQARRQIWASEAPTRHKEESRKSEPLINADAI